MVEQPMAKIKMFCYEYKTAQQQNEQIINFGMYFFLFIFTKE